MQCTDEFKFAPTLEMQLSLKQVQMCAFIYYKNTDPT